MKTPTFHIINTILILLLVGTAGNLHAQDRMDIDEIQVVAPYEPSISDAFKININPTIDDTTRVQMDFDYQIPPQKITTEFEPDPITPARMRGEPLPKLYRGHVKGGFGSYQTPYLEAFYNTLRSNEYALGVNLKHISANNEIEDTPHSLFSHNKANIYGTRFFDNTSLEADILYDREVVHYYGFPFNNQQEADKQDNGNNNLLPEADDIRQQYNFLSSRIGFGSTHADSASTRYHAGLEHHWLSDRYEGNEHHFNFSGEIGREFSADPFEIAKKQYFQLDLSADYYYYEFVGDTLNTGIYSVKPTFYADIDQLSFHAGVDFSVEDDNANYLLRTYPLAGLNMEIVPERLTAYMELSGGLEKQSWRTLSAENPFVMPFPATSFTNIRSEISGGVKGNVGDKVSYHLSLTNSNIDNYPLFGKSGFPDAFNIIDQDISAFQTSQFTVIYDDIRRLHFHAEVFSRFGKRFSMRLRGDFYDYTLDTQQKAWHKPDMLLTLNMSYNIQDKIILTADLYGRGETYGMVISDIPIPPGTIRLEKVHDFYLDANVGIEYRYTKILSVFLDFYNVQNENYARWLDYSSQGFSFMGGVSYSL